MVTKVSTNIYFSGRDSWACNGKLFPFSDVYNILRHELNQPKYQGTFNNSPSSYLTWKWKIICHSKASVFSLCPSTTWRASITPPDREGKNTYISTRQRGWQVSWFAMQRTGVPNDGGESGAKGDRCRTRALIRRVFFFRTSLTLASRKTARTWRWTITGAHQR